MRISSTAEDTPTGAIAFTIGDGETLGGFPDAERQLQRITALVPSANIVFGGSGANRTVTLTPVANANGTATITVTVSDGQATATDTFVVTVTAVNDLPTISSVANQATSIGVAVGPLAVTVGDIETAAASLTLTGSSSNTALVPNANITFGGAGANRTVTVTPAPGASGTASLTLTVNDGTTTATTSFTLTVNAIAPAPLTFAHGASAFTDASGTTQTVQLTGVTVGSLIVAYVKWEGTAASTVTFSDGTSTFTADAIDTAANGDLNGRFYYLPASTKSGAVDLHRHVECGAAVPQSHDL